LGWSFSVVMRMVRSMPERYGEGLCTKNSGQSWSSFFTIVKIVASDTT
jgi:hypothetical protein